MSETRPRLMRAMSAPIRPHPPPEPQDKCTVSHNQNQKRRLRRKKVAPIETDPFSVRIAQHQQYLDKMCYNRPFDENLLTAKLSSRAQKSAKPPKSSVQPRVKSAVNGCEIVTLVSLLSPGASDSEKEDFVNSNSDTPNEKIIPPLRKVGKSGSPTIRKQNQQFDQSTNMCFCFFIVSFQDDDSLGDDDAVIDLPSILRRASLVPLAGKIRIRPPTAPAGSIFHKPSVIR